MEVVPCGWWGTAAPEPLKWASRHDRAILTHNVADFLRLAKQYAQQGWEHSGIVVSQRIPFRILLARVHRLLARREAEDLRNHVDWLQNYR